MAQGSFTPSNTPIYYSDSANMDAFSRIRVSNPTYVFDSQFTYDLQPLLYGQITSGTGATITYDSTNRQALMTFSSTPTGGLSYMQSFDYNRYQSGRSQLALITFNFLSSVANVLKFVGYSDGTNGIELQNTGSQWQFSLLSSTSNGNQIVAQSGWNIDKMDGTGPSGYTLNISTVQILVIDIQALYAGRVRIGFDINGVIYYAHQYTSANITTTPYIANANLPIRCGMSCSGTVSTTMNFICSTVISEGGDIAPIGYNFSQSSTFTAGNATYVHGLSIQPTTTFNGLANRTKFVLDSVNILVTGANAIQWQLVLGQAITGTTTFTAVNSTYSAMQYNTAGTISGSAAIVLASGFVQSAANTGESFIPSISFRNPITLDYSGAVRSLGTLSFIAQGLGATSATYVAINWHELR